MGSTIALPSLNSQKNISNYSLFTTNILRHEGMRNKLIDVDHKLNQRHDPLKINNDEIIRKYLM